MLPDPAAPTVFVPRWQPPAGLPMGPLPVRPLWPRVRFWGQWLYLVPGLLAVVALVVLSFFAEVDIPGFGRSRPKPESRRWDWFYLSLAGYRLALSDDPEGWRKHTERQLRILTARAEDAELRRRRRKPARPPVQPRVTLPVRHYRGLGVGGLAELANARAWAVDWAASPAPASSLALVCIRDLQC